jgi:hypothetical protein
MKSGEITKEKFIERIKKSWDKINAAFPDIEEKLKGFGLNIFETDDNNNNEDADEVDINNPENLKKFQQETKDKMLNMSKEFLNKMAGNSEKSKEMIDKFEKTVENVYEDLNDNFDLKDILESFGDLTDELNNKENTDANKKDNT